MSVETDTRPVSKAELWAGRIISGLLCLGLLFSAFMKFTHPPEVVTDFTGKFGYPESVLFPLAIVELVCTVLYMIPQTSVLGAVLLTGYLGGAVATHVRISDHFIAPIIMGVMAWGGLTLRDRRLRAQLPFKKPS